MFRQLATFGTRVTSSLLTKQQPKFVPHYSNQVRLNSGFVFDVESLEDFNEKVINSPVPVIVDFHADWCAPCKTLGPRLEEKVNGRAGEVLLAKINVDYAGELATDYGISAVPTVFGFKNGEQSIGFQGVIDDDQLEDFIDTLVDQ